MKTQDLKYIETCANEREHASVQKLSCADVRRLLAERAALLDAIRRIRRTSIQETFHGNVVQFQEWLDAFTDAAIAEAQGE